MWEQGLYDEGFEEFERHVNDDLFLNRAVVVRPNENIVDPFAINDDQFIKKFRFSKEVVRQQIVPAVYNNVAPVTNRGFPLDPALKVAVALRYYATNSFQAVCGDMYGISQPSVSKIVQEVSYNLAKHLGNAVHFPTRGVELNYVKQKFYAMHGFPNVVGCVDCTHIPIKSPGGRNPENFRCRKGFFSLNVQLVTGPDLEIFDTVIRWPGSIHDSTIFQNSTVRWRLENPAGDLNGSFLLGDSGYAQTKFLYTPVQNPINRPQQRYNGSHKSTRNSVERAIGVLKRRFPCLHSKLRTQLKTSMRTIAACCVLHNIGRLHDPRDFIEEANVNNDWDRHVVDVVNVRENERGRRIKEAFIMRHFLRA